MHVNQWVGSQDRTIQNHRGLVLLCNSLRYKDLMYLQHTYLSNIIPKSKLIELNAFFMEQLESNIEIIILSFIH